MLVRLIYCIIRAGRTDTEHASEVNVVSMVPYEIQTRLPERGFDELDGFCASPRERGLTDFITKVLRRHGIRNRDASGRRPGLAARNRTTGATPGPGSWQSRYHSATKTDARSERPLAWRHSRRSWPLHRSMPPRQRGALWAMSWALMRSCCRRLWGPFIACRRSCADGGNAGTTHMLLDVRRSPWVASC